MARDKKKSRQFNISVEGVNCEKMYFEHLAGLINFLDFLQTGLYQLHL